MKRLLKSKLELILLLSLAVSIFLMIVFYNDVLTNITIFIYSQMIPYNIVFDPSIDKSEYDASQIINCLHSSPDSGGCPEGITFVNDETGQVEPRTITSKKSEKVIDYSPESQGYVASVPDSVAKYVPMADNISYLVYGLIIISLLIIIIILIKRRKSVKKM